MQQYNTLGSTLKKFRLEMGMSQQQLAQDICTQAQISKIEKGDILPLSSTLSELTSRLGITLDYFFSFVRSPEFDYVSDFFYFLRKHARNKEYDEALWMVQKEKDNPLFDSKDKKQFLLWHEGMCHFQIYKNADYAMQCLCASLDLTPQINRIYSERQTEILNSIGIIHDQLHEYSQAAETFHTALQSLDKLPLVQDRNIQLRLYYNLSKALINLEQYQNSLLYCQKGIKLCIQEERLYLFGELHYQMGINLVNLQRREEGRSYINKARSIFELTHKTELITIVDRELNSWSS
ncbi:helix-turn-helix domain-containing protein [Paenibacillus kandeliae]|uniref:helix-turn-helix domain-containing protein n=1 Tax=Paenibacillus kandeliae TaxID=3231269 RepID=UPI0034574A47